MRKPHDPIIPDGDRRCHRCRLLAEEHPPLSYVAIIDTGGIKHSGRILVALGETESEARATVAKALIGSRGHRTGYGDLLRTVDDVSDYYGIRTYGPVADGYAVEGD